MPRPSSRQPGKEGGEGGRRGRRWPRRRRTLKLRGSAAAPFQVGAPLAVGLLGPTAHLYGESEMPRASDGADAQTPATTSKAGHVFGETLLGHYGIAPTKGTVRRSSRRSSMPWGGDVGDPAQSESPPDSAPRQQLQQTELWMGESEPVPVRRRLEAAPGECASDRSADTLKGQRSSPTAAAVEHSGYLHHTASPPASGGSHGNLLPPRQTWRHGDRATHCVHSAGGMWPPPPPSSSRSSTAMTRAYPARIRKCHPHTHHQYTAVHGDNQSYRHCHRPGNQLSHEPQLQDTTPVTPPHRSSTR